MSLIKQINEKLEGLPDTILTVILVALGILAIVVAIWGKPVSKAALAAWYIFP